MSAFIRKVSPRIKKELEDLRAEIAKMRDDNEKQNGEWTREYRRKLDLIHLFEQQADEAVQYTAELKDEIKAQASLLAKARVAFEEIAADECYVGSGDEGEMMGEEHCGHCIAKEALALLDSSDPKAAEIERLTEAVIEAARGLGKEVLSNPLKSPQFTPLLKSLCELDDALAKIKKAKGAGGEK